MPARVFDPMLFHDYKPTAYKFVFERTKNPKVDHFKAVFYAWIWERGYEIFLGKFSSAYEAACYRERYIYEHEMWVTQNYGIDKHDIFKVKLKAEHRKQTQSNNFTRSSDWKRNLALSLVPSSHNENKQTPEYGVDIDMFNAFS